MEANLERDGSTWKRDESEFKRNGSESGAGWTRIRSGMEANLEQDGSESGAE